TQPLPVIPGSCCLEIVPHRLTKLARLQGSLHLSQKLHVRLDANLGYLARFIRRAENQLPRRASPAIHTNNGGEFQDATSSAVERITRIESGDNPALMT